MTRGRRSVASSAPLPPRDEAREGDRVLATTWTPFAVQGAPLANDTGIDFLIAGIGGGKSQVGAVKLLRWCLRWPFGKAGKPARALVLGKDFRLAKDAQFGLILAAIDKLGLPRSLVVRDVRYGERPRILLWSGVEIHAFSGTDDDSTRGFEAEFVWADEAENMTARSLMTAISRTRGAEAMRVVVTSSPDGFSGWIYPLVSGEYEEWRDFVAQNDVRVHRWRSDENPHLSRSQLRGLRAAQNAAGRDLATQELDGRFLGTAEAPGGGPVEWALAFVGRIDIADARAAVVGADLGKNPDFCWFTAANRDGVVLAQERFNVGDYDGPPAPHGKYWTWARGRLVRFVHAAKARLVVVDGARGGDMFAENLQEVLGQEVKVLDYRTDAVGKKAAACEALAKACELGQWRIPTSVNGRPVEHVEDLRKELRKLLITDLGSGKRRFDHGEGSHDDGLVSHALARHGLTSEPPPTDEEAVAGWEPLPSGPSTFGGGGGANFGGGSKWGSPPGSPWR